MMNVKKRDGRLESVKFDKITARIENLCYSLDLDYVSPIALAKKVINGLYNGVTTQEIDELTAQAAAAMGTTHPDFGVLAARISVSNLHKTTSSSFYNTIHRLYNNKDAKTGKNAPLISKEAYLIIKNNAELLDNEVNYSRDFEYNYFGFKTLQRSYLMRVDGVIVERPQHMLMRVAIGIHMDNIEDAIQSYYLMSERWFTHATPTLFNAATPKPQLSSCFLLAMKEDSIDGIYDTLKSTAKISQSAGGVGLHVHDIRAKGSYIRGTGGYSNGLVPMLRNFDMTARYVDQGGGKRKGSFAIYLEPWHADVYDFLELKKNHGKEEFRARDLFYALWVPDLFMKRVESDAMWSLFCPNEAPGLSDVYGEKFEQLYCKYEKEGKYKKQVKARELWKRVVISQMETGTPYMLYKDACNKKSNQKNLGVIKSSNLCTEIIEYTAPDEVAVCNLASIALPRFAKENKTFDHDKLYEITYLVTVNLNKVIDINYYPVEEAKRSNMRHRPIGIGVQGLADLFLMMRYPFDSPEAKKLNKEIAETMYFAAMTASNDLAKTDGHYQTWEGSPVSQGLFQFDMWGVQPSSRWNWLKLKQSVKKFGVRNSLLMAPMPTASSSQILGNAECFEPYTYNIYTRRTISGEFSVVNKYLLNDLIKLNLWNEDMKNRLILSDGSVQGIDEIPNHLKALYKTVWEISQKVIIEMAADRGAFTCQSQSMNLFMADPSIEKVSSMHFYAWKKGLKTGMYYLRSKAATAPIKFTAKKITSQEDNSTSHAIKDEIKPINNEESVKIACSLDNQDGCETCSA